SLVLLLSYISFLFFFFFFSSRRRHTRFSRDWSSDVCSSDLKAAALPVAVFCCGHQDGLEDPGSSRPSGKLQLFEAVKLYGRIERSEERRVGKECRCRWRTYDSKKKRNRTQIKD